MRLSVFIFGARPLVYFLGVKLCHACRIIHFSINLFFISISIFLGLYDRHNIGLAVLTLFCGSILQFSYTIHYPIDNLTSTYNPIFNIIINSSALLLSKYVFSFNPILIMAVISVSFLIISSYISIRLIKGKYER